MMTDPNVTRYLGDGKPLTRVEAWRQMAMLSGHWNLRGFGIWAAEERETAVRLSLGAGRGRLVRQFLTHALILSACGAAAGVLFAEWGTSLLVVMISRRHEPLFFDLTPDWRVIAFAGATTMVTVALPPTAPNSSVAR